MTGAVLSLATSAFVTASECMSLSRLFKSRHFGYCVYKVYIDNPGCSAYISMPAPQCWNAVNRTSGGEGKASIAISNDEI